jgi:hypothetical protein
VRAHYLGSRFQPGAAHPVPFGIIRQSSIHLVNKVSRRTCHLKWFRFVRRGADQLRRTTAERPDVDEQARPWVTGAMIPPHRS